MGLPMESADNQSSHQALLDLERDTTAPVELLESVALILGVNYEALSLEAASAVEAGQSDIANEFAPREEWVLRWMLKRSGLSGLPSKVKTAETATVRMCSDRRTWLLINHLLNVASYGVIAKVLAENEFLNHLERCLPAVLEASVEDTFSELPKKVLSKKRKRPSTATVSKASLISASGDFHPRSIAILIGLALHRLAQIAELETVASEHVRFALSVPANITASLVGKLISNLIGSISVESTNAVSSSVIRIIAGIAKLWNYRRYDGLEEGVQNRAFTIECLRPLLGTFAKLNSSGSKDCAGLKTQIERLIALHCILPSRSAFFREHSDTAQDSKRSQEQLRAALLPSAPSGQGSEIALLLDIAIRSMSKGNLRRRQHEQPWLETLFFMLVDCVGQEGLQVLLDTAIKHNLELSRSRLSQLALVHISSSLVEWSMIAKIVELNPAVCLPTCPCTLESLFDQINASESSLSLKIIRDNILQPMLRTFARSRELTAFMAVWHGFLARTIGNGEAIWQDQQLFAVFSDVLKEHPTSISLRSVLEKVIGDLQHAIDNVNGDPDAHASLAVVETVLAARSEDCRNQLELLQTISRACRSWLEIRAADLPQRWRWWRMIRRVVNLLQEDQLDPALEQVLVVLDLESNGIDSPLEAVECFHLLCELFGRNADIANLLTKQLDGLAAHISKGRAAAVSGASNVVLTSMAIMLQQPHVLALVATTKLWRDLWQCISDPSIITGSTYDRSRQIYRAFLMSEVITDSPALVRQTFDIIFDTFQPGHQTDLIHPVLTDLPLQQVKKAKLEDLASRLLDSLRPDSGLGERDVMSGAALLARIVQAANVSIGRVQAWSQLQELVERLSEVCKSKDIEADWRDSIAFSARMIVRAVQQRAKDSENTELNDEDFEELLTQFSLKSPRKEVATTELIQLEQLATSMTSQPFSSQKLTDLNNPTSFEHFCLAADYINLSLSPKTTHQVNQWTIDNLLSILVTVTSPHGTTFTSTPPNGPAAIYRRLTSLLGTILSHHRHRLGGRYHLLVPVLQSLLRCLFCPIPTPTSAKQPKIQDAQPPWSKSKLADPLNPTSSTQLTRILTSLTSPTASAVRRHKSQSSSTAALTDETKKARAIAGQYLLHVIMSYCSFQLQGVLAPDVKSALMPGLYAVLDVMGRDGMRAMNSAMGASERAIWKGLYDDWRMFGRWDGR